MKTLAQIKPQAFAQSANEFCQVHNSQKVISFGTGRVICTHCELENARASHRKNADASIREKHFHGAQIPARHAQSGLKNYIADTQGRATAKASATAYIKHLRDGGKQNLVMVGSTGTGKTHLACATAHNLLDNGMFVRYVTSEHLANDISSAYSRKDDTEKSAILRYTDLDVLIIDEYGLHDRSAKSPYILECVHKVLYARYDAMKPTMLISNMSLNEIKSDLGDRLWSRFQDGGLSVIECNWTDARTTK